jgi:regulatory protein
VTAELERLAEVGLQSDERFAEFYVRERIERGDGPRKIQAALAERGIPGQVIEAALAPFSEEWLDRAAHAAARRFGTAAPESLRERARRARFLEQRGFPADVIRRVSRHDMDE